MRVSQCELDVDCVIELHTTIEEELSEDVDTGLLGDLVNVASRIAEWFD